MELLSAPKQWQLAIERELGLDIRLTIVLVAVRDFVMKTQYR
jgi:hypothetical protein